MTKCYKHIPEISIATVDAYFADTHRHSAQHQNMTDIDNEGIKHLIERVKRIERSDMEKLAYIAGLLDALAIVDRQIESNELEKLI